MDSCLPVFCPSAHRSLHYETGSRGTNSFEACLIIDRKRKRTERSICAEYDGKNLKAIVEKRKTLLRAVTENFIHTELIIPETFDPESIKGKEVMVKITEKSTLSNCEAKAIYIELI